MDYDQLNTFLTVCKVTNYSRAAERLNVTQPTVTARIQNLENELNCKLFHRLGRTIVLSKEGEILSRYAEKILNYMNEAKESISLIANPRLKIGFSPGFSSGIVLDALHIFESTHNLMLKIIEGQDSNDMVNKVLNKEIDLAFVRIFSPHPELAARHICDDKLIFIVGAEHRLANKSKITKEDLMGETMICYLRHTPIWSKIEEKLVGVEIKRIEIGTLEMLKSMVLNNWGFSIIPSLSLEKDEKHQLCIKPFEVSDDISNKVIAVFHKDSSNMQNIQLFIQSFSNHLVTFT
jgi:DNA-binding transcriptional LysR family regulator